MASVTTLVTGDEHYFDEATITPEKIRKLLDGGSSSNSKAGTIEKTQGMKYLLAQMSKGRDVSDYYADVVRNVIVKSVEVKKLVYMYLVHHADANAECRELALLAINSFQRSLSDSNQLIRGLALRVMCSIRVREIVPIQMMAVKKASSDSSPYVRKTAALSAVKIYSIDHDQQEELYEVLERLLNDDNLMVLSSVLAAFSEICPDRLSMLHRHYRRLCRLVPDLDDWGQVTLVNILVRYARTQFEDPSKKEVQTSGSNRRTKKKNGFYSDDSSEESSSEEDEVVAGSLESLEADHRLVLESIIPLLRSRNSAVILAAASLYYYVAPQQETLLGARVGQALVRLSGVSREVQYLMLRNIAAMAKGRPSMFRPYIKDFFAAESEPSFVRKMKVDILAAIVYSGNTSLILQEFTRYIADDDKEFVRHVIQAVAHVANTVPDVADRCLKGLMGLVASGQPQEVVAQAIVMIRQLVQTHTQHDTIIVRLARMLPLVEEPTARAAIVWIIAEFWTKPAVGKMAPDALRQLAKTFRQEDPQVKTQILNLASKLALRDVSTTDSSRKIRLLCQYVFELARFDADFDLRDRARFMRKLLSDVRAEDKQLQSVPSSIQEQFIPETSVETKETTTNKTMQEATEEEQEETTGVGMSDETKETSKHDEDENANDANDANANDDATASATATTKNTNDTDDDADDDADDMDEPAASTKSIPMDTTISHTSNNGTVVQATSNETDQPVHIDIKSPAMPSPNISNKQNHTQTKLNHPIRQRAERIILTAKPPPMIASTIADANILALGSLSHAVGHRVRAYLDIPAWSSTSTDASIRDPSRYTSVKTKKSKHSKQTRHSTKNVKESKHTNELDQFLDTDEEDEASGTDESSSNEEESSIDDETSSEEEIDESENDTATSSEEEESEQESEEEESDDDDAIISGEDSEEEESSSEEEQEE